MLRTRGYRWFTTIMKPTAFRHMTISGHNARGHTTDPCGHSACSSGHNSSYSRVTKDYHLLFIFIVFCMTLPLTTGQTYRPFPSLYNVAKYKTIYTEPSDGTCGVPSRSAYCRSTPSPTSLEECRQEYCIQDCPRRTALPSSSNLMRASNYGICVTTDTVNRRPGSAADGFSAVFTSGASCYVHPLDRLALGANGAFTLTFWIWQNAGNIGTIIEKYTETRQTIFRLRVSATSIFFLYRTNFGLREVQLLDSLPSNTWNFIAIQVYDASLSYFINGTSIGSSARGTRGLVSAVRDANGIIRLGQANNGTDQFTGRIQDGTFFAETLTNREIQQVYSGVLPTVFIQSTCRCPPTHPRIRPLRTHFCIRNGVPDNNGDEIRRLNNDSHPLQYANDGDSNSIWISSFLEDITINVNLGDTFEVFYVVLQFYSPLPKVVTIERRKDAVSPWKPWQWYAEDCTMAFNMVNNGPLPTPSSVNCIQLGTNGLTIPYSKGNITFNLLSSEPETRPGHNDFYNTPQLGEFVLASNVRVRMQGRYNATHPRRKYYGIYEYIVTGRCDCHGHAADCDASGLPYQCQCLTESNTEGRNCERCAPLYNNKPYRDGDQVLPYNCRSCTCHDHAASCVYDASQDPFPSDHDKGGGGVCVNCQHNTAGRFCENCQELYYRPLEKSLYDADVCSECQCYNAGVQGDKMDCTNAGGQCTCKAWVTGRQCDACRTGYYNLQAGNPMGCEECYCNMAGSGNGNASCNANTGQCYCKQNVRNDKCDACQYGFYGLNAADPLGCSACGCHPRGTLDVYCNPDSGQCNCHTNVIGRQCDECADGYHNFEAGCVPCDCSDLGSQAGTTCDKVTGQCLCKPYVEGVRCDGCRDGFYSLGADFINGCVNCGCYPAGTNNQSEICNKITGECECKPNVQGRSCNQCKPNTYNLTGSSDDGCVMCGCDPSGTLQGDMLVPHQLTCDQNNGQCACLVNRQGSKCDACAPDYYQNKVPGGGCNQCDCLAGGTIPLTHCDQLTGQCQCKQAGSWIAGRRCDTCLDGYYGFNRGSCTPCECDVAGSTNATSCDANTGQCQCKQFTTSRQCGSCVTGTSNLQTDNSYGCSKQPNQQPPPEYELLSPTGLRLYWSPPDHPNGVILKYVLYRDGEILVTLNANNMEYNDTGLIPFTTYSYHLVAYNDNGSTTSPAVSFRTPPGPPAGTINLYVSDIQQRSATFTWTSPPVSNGILEYYELNATVYGLSEQQTFYKGLGLQAHISNLKSYMFYEFLVSACTDGGCLQSPGIEVITKESMPEAQSPPTITPLSASELYISWLPPANPHGVIIYYELWMRGTLNSVGQRDPPNTRIFHPAGQYDPLNLPRPQPLPAPATNFTARDLVPFKDYEFQVISQNSIGLAASSWVTARTGESAPDFMPTPFIYPISSDSVNVTWTPPSSSEARGDILSYRVYHYRQNNLDNTPFAPPNIWLVVRITPGYVLFAIVDGLPPYSDEVFIVEACNTVGCVNSSEAVGRTLPGAPSSVPDLQIEGYNQSTISIAWAAPQELNGPEPYYTVRRRQVALSKPPPLVTRGVRFPGTGYQMFPPDTIPSGVGFTGIQLEFKTRQREGLIMFAASEGGQEEFLAIQLRAGRPWFLYDPQGCRTYVTVDLSDDFDVIMFDEEGNMRENVTFSGVTFDDGKWHSLVARRRVISANISLDGEYIGCISIVTTTDDEGLPYNRYSWNHLKVMRTGLQGTIRLNHTWTGNDTISLNDMWTGGKDTDCTTGNIIGRNTGVYIGGLPDDYILQRVESDDRARVNNRNFEGCIRNVQVLSQLVPEEVWVPLNWSSAIKRHTTAPSWEGCPENLDPERAVHYLGTGYVIYTPIFMNEFIKPRRFAPYVEFQLRTDRRSGILFFAYGVVGYYQLLQLVDGNLVWMTGTTHIKRQVVFPSSNVNLCDGAWHTVRLEKPGGKMTIEVDFFSKVVDGSGPLSAENIIVLTSDMYVGGIPPLDAVQQAVKDNGLTNVIQTNFGGCLRNIKTDRIEPTSLEVRDVYLDGCPSPGTNLPTCQDVDFQVIYNGSSNATFDLQLDSFTEYIYQVEAHNSAGKNTSRWETGRTREGPPEGVSGPYLVMVVNGFTVKASWDRPTGHTGQITAYRLHAVDRDNMMAPPVEMEFPPETFTGDMTNAIPFTNYTLYLVACTAGGCTRSAQSVDITTFEEAPTGVTAPVAVDTGGTYLQIGWVTPEHPNGILTGYALYMEGSEVYSGAQMSYNITALNVFNSYRFFVRVCSRVGCTDSDTVSLATSQLPPTFVAPPQLTIKGTHIIEAQWQTPDQLNGVLERYILYASRDPRDNGDVVYNSTIFILKYDIPDLLAGTKYYIRVQACTGGGCTISESTSDVTFESAPEGLPDPVIRAISPTQLYVTWGLPQFPNGVITQYRLFQNGLLISTQPNTREFTISNLLPWSLHLLRVEACTIKGCGSTTEVSARTQEAPPVGTIGLDLIVEGPRAVRALWNGVDEANGVVSYDVYFEGLFYVDPDFNNYNTQTDRRSLLTTEAAGDWMTIDGLIPYTVYYVQINGSNTAGFLLSNIKQARMPQGAPDGVIPPTVTSPSPTTAQIDWHPVGRTNSDINPTFQLQFKESASIIDLFSQPTTSNSYMKTGLSPFVEYEFRVVAINPYGQTQSEWVKITTRQDRPKAVDPPRAFNVSSRSVSLEWDPPLAANGIIIEYKIFKNSVQQLSVDGNATVAFVDELRPYSRYTFQISACTLAGCTMSGSSREVYTLQDVPEDISAPSLVSQTPTSVLVVWTEPGSKNGQILQYGIERRLPGSADVTLVRTFLVNDPKQFLDQSAAVMPHTAYEYRITAETIIGKSQGPWAGITTKASRPGGVQAPIVHVLSPTSMEIQWAPPIQPNGRLESYMIALPEPRFDISNTSQMSLMVENLTPFTNYSVTVTACSEGGCTKSQATEVSTSPASPVGLAAPIGTPISQTYISILWDKPEKPNGPNLQYELSRMKLRQPLNPLAVDFGTWTALYLGQNTYYDDRGLSMYTTYAYRVTVYNDYGHTISDPSEGVITFGGTPTKAAVVSLSLVNHTSFIVRWTTPSVQELQGGVSKYVVNVDGGNVTQYEVSPTEAKTTVKGLYPNTRYQVTVTIVIHGGETIDSEPAILTTSDGAPEGLAAPYKLIINQTTVRISWSAPTNPNGEIIGYYLYVDDVQIDTGQTTPGSYFLTNLQPYTIYRVQVEVCTIYACIRSPEITVTTAESIPAGVAPPTLSVISPNDITASWGAPQEPNGVILRYELLRKKKVPCSDIVVVDPEPNVGRCTYLECGVLESFCGDQCYSGPKTCCDGVVYDNIQGYECCGTSYIPQRNNPSDVCCGGNFYSLLANHVCCGDRYVQLFTGQICCPDTTQDRVDIGYGDQCCGSIPYSGGGAQICCDGGLYARFGQQCCGDRVVSDDLLCCGNDTWGQAHVRNTTNTCCGDEYVPQDRSACCGDGIEGYKSHVYTTPSARITANEKCCGKESISMSLSCCHGNGFNPFMQFCADISTMQSGCGNGVICPVDQEGTAYCNRCNFDRSSHKCGSYVAKSKRRKQYMEDAISAAKQQEGELCETMAVKVYTGIDLEFKDSNLSPYTKYLYALVAVNGAGSTTSAFTFTTTAEALPEGFAPPIAEVLPQQLDTIYLTWKSPEKPNGEILSYVLFRDDIELYSDPSSKQYRDDNAILPYQTYRYRLHVCNRAGCVQSDEIEVSTLQARPEKVAPPVVNADSSSSLRVTWLSPGRPNGHITMYILYEVSTLGTVATVASTLRDYVIEDLSPYTTYTVLLSACTDAGCTNSTATTGTTLQDKPQGLSPVRAVIMDHTSAELYWSAPTQPNGIITSYTLQSSNSGTVFQPIYSGSDLNYTDTGLLSGRLYWYKVTATTLVGSTDSEVSSFTVPQLTPQGIKPPTNVTVLGSESIYVEWSQPEILNGIIDQYQVLLNGGQSDEIKQGFGLDMSGRIDALKPYTEYTVRIQVCLRGMENSCGTGAGVTVRTFEAIPQGQAPPRLVAKASDVVQISWEPPVRPNGVITSYRIHRRLVGSTLEVLIAVVDGDVFGFVNSAPELVPHTQYEYRLTASNSQGDLVSNWAAVYTLESTPEGMNPPTLSAVGAYSITLSWTPPFYSNGDIVTYQIDYHTLLSDPTSGVTTSVVVAGDIRMTSVSGLVPYTAYEIRVTAANSVGSASSTWVVATTSQAAPADIGPFIIEKVSSGTSLILTWPVPQKPNGVINNYLIYEAGNVNAIYQGLNREFEYRRLVPYTEYTVQLEACTVGGCVRSLLQKVTTAEVQPGNQPAPTLGPINSTSVSLRWLAPLASNGKILSYEVLRQMGAARRKRQIAEPVVIYKTTDTDGQTYEYTDSDIEPYSVYHYQIKSCNSVGCTVSDSLRVETPQGPPTGLAPPSVSQVPNKHDELYVTWAPPGKANGVLRDYQLQRNDSTPWSFAPDEERQFNDRGLIAHTYYGYRVTVCTQGGCTTSETTVMRTPQTAPLLVQPPSLFTVNASSIRVTWIEPDVINGNIVEYRLIIDDNIVYRGLALFYTALNLRPFQAYTFRLTACTSGGCTNSSAVSGRPNEDRPIGMQPPTLRVTSSTSIEVAWKEPDQPNGIITSYELRRDNVLISTNSLLQYIDYEVEPGKTYSYTVTAFNSRGSTTSVPGIATTYSSSPMGLAAPDLQPLSSTSIRATWSPPLNPNGIIRNYTLYRGNLEVYTDLQLMNVVRDLNYWTEYSFRVKACTNRGCTTSDPATARTLEAIPEGLSAPKLTPLADANGAHSGILVQWAPPRKPNGIIDRYEIYRRMYNGVATGGSGTLVYSGGSEEYTDLDSVLQPYTQYQYRVVAYNNEGQVTSDWYMTRTQEAPPRNVYPPEVKSKTATTLTLELREPEKTNGYINSYIVFLNGKQVAHRLSLLIIIGEKNPLIPYTMYTIYIEACTAGGCTPSPSIEQRTESRDPTGLQPPTVINITASSADVYWEAPTQPNGPIVAYEMSLRKICPYPFAESTDALVYPCEVSPWVTKTRGSDMLVHITGLLPYTRYQFRVVIQNDVGTESQSVEAVTKPTAPMYSGIPFKIHATGGSILIDWTQSFLINGEVDRFVFYKNGTAEFTGSALTYSVLRTNLYATYNFQVVLITTEGQAQTPRMDFDPARGGVLVNGTVIVNQTEVPPSTAIPVAVVTIPVYQETWFIALMAILALFIICIVIALCFGTCWRRKVPYIRERMPLPPRQKKADVPLAYVMEPYDRNLIATEMPPAEHMPERHMPERYPAQNVAHVGYINPAYSHLSIPSRATSLADLNLDHLSHKSTNWGDEDNDSIWDGHPGRDSGLHSLAYGDDYDADSDRPISVLKEHTMFTDTHV